MPIAIKTLDVIGLSYFQNYVSIAEQEEILGHVDSSAWDLSLKRRTQHYGWRYDYRSKSVDLSMRLGELPLWLEFLAIRIRISLALDFDFDQAIVNEYIPGQGISKHIDCVPCFGSVIASISLGSDCVMEFERGSERKELTLAKRSLLVLRDEARYNWTHAIPARIYDTNEGATWFRQRRVSLTFRKVHTD